MRTLCVMSALLPARSVAVTVRLEAASPVGIWVRAKDTRQLPSLATVVLDQVQDAGNVGSVLRSAAAFGFAQVVALRGTAGLWSPKVVRAGMGAHFALRLVESASVADALALRVPLIATSSHQGDWLHQCEGELSLPWPCAWLLGHEGQGVQAALLDAAQRRVRIAQPGGEESLNVAAAAAVCLHASAAAQARLKTT